VVATSLGSKAYDVISSPRVEVSAKVRNYALQIDAFVSNAAVSDGSRCLVDSEEEQNAVRASIPRSSRKRTSIPWESIPYLPHIWFGRPNQKVTLST
jgi:hypothetical protein